MPPASLSREEVVTRLMAVVRRRGYEAASLAELSKATGLGKSSLYHHFPAGKEDMIGAVLEHLESLLESQVFAPLRAPGPAQARIRAMVATLDAFYRGGRDACVLALLGIGDAPRRFQPRIRRIFAAWIEAFAAALQDAGHHRAVARARAEDAIIRIEGALVLTRAMDDPAVFERTLEALTVDVLRK